MIYRIDYSPDVEEHLRALTARQQALVLGAVDVQLSHEPGVRTRNRKPMRESSLSAWELRVECLRVYYDVQSEPEPTVLVRAVGIKLRDLVRIGKETFRL